MKKKQLEDDRQKLPLSNTVEVGVENFDVDCEKVAHILEIIAKQYKVESFQISLTFVSQEKMQELNKEYRNKSRSTDVLSFPQIEWREAITAEKLAGKKIQEFQREEEGFCSPLSILGDIMISLDDAEQNAKNIGQCLEREICFLLVHGFLHLLGHDHIEKPDEVIMQKEQDLLMKLLEPKKKPLWDNCVHRLVGSN